jgi:hypothetical protein
MSEIARIVGVSAVVAVLVGGGTAFFVDRHVRAEVREEQERQAARVEAARVLEAIRAPTSASIDGAIGRSPLAASPSSKSVPASAPLDDVDMLSASLRQVIGDDHLMSLPELARFGAPRFAHFKDGARDEFTAELFREAQEAGIATADVDRTLLRRSAERVELDAALADLESEIARAIDDAVASGALVRAATPEGFAALRDERRARGVAPLFEMQGALTHGGSSQCFLLSIAPDDAPAAELARRRALDLAERYESNVRAELGH